MFQVGQDLPAQQGATAAGKSNGITVGSTGSGNGGDVMNGVLIIPLISLLQQD